MTDHAGRNGTQGRTGTGIGARAGTVLPDTPSPTLAELPAHHDSPLAYAVNARDRQVCDIVSEALDHGNVTLAFQPVVQAGAPGKVAFYEGLIRVLDETGRVIPARDFMPSVEETELGRRLDCAALRHGLRALAQTPALRLSINMSARSIGFPGWMRELDRGLRRDRTVAERLILEITESSAMLVPELVVHFMDELQRRDVSFALDDFGAGYTAFRYLKQFQFDILKIDGQFIRGISDQPDNQVLTQALAAIARQFDMFTVAESVERAEDAAWLADCGIDCLQGYYFGAPTTSPPWRSRATGRMTA